MIIQNITKSMQDMQWTVSACFFMVKLKQQICLSYAKILSLSEKTNINSSGRKRMSRE